VTDYPETPGNGHWEINLAATGAHTSGQWDIAAPDVDINYGWGEHVQLKLDVPWLFVHETDQPRKSGLGAPDLGVKWRFGRHRGLRILDVDVPSVREELAVVFGDQGNKRARGAVSLAIEVATVAGEYGARRRGRSNLVQFGADQWVAGAIVAHSCGKNLECLGEVHEVLAPHNSQTPAERRGPL